VQFQKPFCELDTSLFVPFQTLVYISTGNVLFHPGMYDSVSLQMTSSKAGLWISRQDVPAAVYNSDLSANTYNVPQLPYPGATGTVSGGAGSLKGDADGANVFWLFVSQIPAC